MKRSEGFLLKNVGGSRCLLPYGRAIADRARGTTLNETGAFVWEYLENEPSREELTREFIRRYSDGAEDESELKRDLDGFLSAMVSWGYIVGDPPEPKLPPKNAELEIAGLGIALSCPENFVEYGMLKKFRKKTGREDMRVGVTVGKTEPEPSGREVLRSFDLEVYESGGGFLMLFPSLSKINGARLSRDGTRAEIFCRDDSDEAGEEFFHVLRHAFLYLAGRRGMYAIHSASILYRGGAWLFYASSGTGKSTHTALWNRLYGAEFLNGDLNLLAFDGARPVVLGIPWCGTSEICTEKRYPLGGIVFLRQSPRDEISELSATERALSVLRRFISPMWDEKAAERAADFAERISGSVPLCLLSCTKENSAAETAKNWVDGQIDG